MASVLLHTQEMMVAVIEEQWDALMDMQLSQDEMLKQLFSVNNTLFSTEEKQDLFEVQRLNQEVLSAAQSHKSEIANKLRSLQQGKAKTTIYQAL